jgi:hypothetical protein
MKNNINALLTTCLLLLVFLEAALAQEYNTPLTMQGLNHTTDASVASRAMGGVTLTLKNDASVMFSNPAALQTLDAIQFLVGGFEQFRTVEQTQQWFPMLYYSNFSLLMQGLTGGIPNPDTSKPWVVLNTSNAGDTVQRPFDSIEPDWKYSKSKSLPLQGFVAMPFSIGGIKLVAGLGAVEYANLNYYYENNNVLSPDFGSLSSKVYVLPASDDNAYAMPVHWYQTIRERVGSVHGYGGAVSAALSEELAFGVSALFLRGSTDDNEFSLGRGVLMMHRNYFGLSPYQYKTSQIGTSDFSGQEYTFSGTYQVRSVSLGFAVKPPTTITRDYTGILQIDTTGTPLTSNVNSTDKIKLPWRATAGLGVNVGHNVLISLEYGYLPYGSADYTQGSTTSNPWLDGSAFRFGVECLPTPWLALRTGYCIQAEVFQPEGNPVPGQPLSSSVYSGGIGLTFASVRVDVAYEYSSLRYEDSWATNVNINNEVRQNIVASVSYVLPR